MGPLLVSCGNIDGPFYSVARSAAGSARLAPAGKEGSCMGTTIRYFRVNPSGALVRVSLAQMQRWFRGEQVPPALATDGELTFLEALVETEGRQVTEVLRLVPFRWALGRNGKLDRIAATRLAKKRIELQTRAQGRNGEASAIELLEADANYFWWPTDAQLKLLGSALLGERLDVEELVELRAKVFRPDDARPH
jgi:hypothetical protein